MWLKNPTPEHLNGMSDGTLMQALGIQFVGINEDSLTATMPVDGRTRQPFGLLHGGASVALAETLGSTASHLCIDEEKQFSVGLEINANHVRSMRTGLVTGVARAVHVGRTTHIWDIRISDEKGRLVCICRLTTAIRDRIG